MNLQAMEALAADAVWYYTRTMCQIALPPSSLKTNEYIRNSGTHHLVVQAPPMTEVPWGIYPRGILNWITTEIVRQKNSPDASRNLPLGKSLADFMSKVSGSRNYSGGKTGNIGPFKRQLSSLLSSRIFFWIGDTKFDVSTDPFVSMQIAHSGNLMWHPKLISQPGLLDSTIEVSEEFYQDCIRHGVPVDVRIIRALWPNCMAFDIYVWLTYRAYTLSRDRRWSIDLSWGMLKAQFGHTFHLMKNFRPRFLESLGVVSNIYTGMEFVEREGKGMTFRFKRPSVSTSTSVPRIS